MRWEYLISGVIACGLVGALDRALGTRLLGQGRFWRCLGILLICQFIFESYATSRPVFLYDPCCIVGLRIIATPVEDFLFGPALYGLVIVLWEWGGRDPGRAGAGT